MKHWLGQRLRAGLRRTGYDVHRIARYPYIFEHTLQGQAFRFAITDDTAQAWYTASAWWQAAAEPRELARLVKPGDRVLEIGCHHGFLTTFLARIVGEQGFVLALDADDENCAVANTQLRLNGLTGMACILNAAGADRAGQLRLTKDPTGNSHINANHTALEAVTVLAVTGDALLQTFGPFDVLKIDAEGYEGQILAGCQELLRRRPKLALEIHNQAGLLEGHGSSARAIFELIQAQDYAGSMVVRPEPTVSRPFSVDNFPTNEIVNVFLSWAGTA